MIQITKPRQPPAILKTTGKAKRRGLSTAFTRFAEDYVRGDKRFNFENGVYAHESVKKALIAAQHDKCAFCESKITHISYGDVEHFRPKKAYRQNANDALTTPGYYWLAYEWDNLFLACQLCNQRHKGNLFPLANPAGRATSHKHNTELEQPLFIDPALDDPEEYISFRREIPYPVSDKPRGLNTIINLGLERPELSEVRYDRYEKLRLIYVLANANPPLPESAQAQDHLNRAIRNSAEFASMARSAIASQFSL
jgi:uncharacterized protein (TIGR02646 family)